MLQPMHTIDSKAAIRLASASDVRKARAYGFAFASFLLSLLNFFLMALRWISPKGEATNVQVALFCFLGTQFICALIGFFGSVWVTFKDRSAAFALIAVTLLLISLASGVAGFVSLLPGSGW